MCETAEEELKLDVCATVPELAFISPLRRWRNLALAFDIRSRVEDDPMAKGTAEHEKSLFRLSRIAQNTMISQGKLYAFVVGIYGRRARLYRFDRCGGVCSPQFNYATEPHVLHDFLWRFVHPKFEGCLVLGDDPTVKRGTHADRSLVQKLVKKHDPEYAYTAESRKAIRRLTVTQDDGKKATYLAYKLIHIDTTLGSRASTVWEAFALDGNGEATGRRVVVKEAWQLTSLPSETRFYHDLREAAEAAEDGAELSLSGIVKMECCNDLGTHEFETLAHGGPRPGHRTMPSKYGKNAYQRNLVRIVFATIGTPLTMFKSTYDAACALRDAIEGEIHCYHVCDASAYLFRRIHRSPTSLPGWHHSQRRQYRQRDDGEKGRRDRWWLHPRLGLRIQLEAILG